MSRLLIVSNRLPITITKKNGKLNYKSSVGGVATGLGSFYKSFDSQWIGWPGIVNDELSEKEKNKIKEKLKNENCCPVFISESDLEKYYEGFCNKTIWPLFHYFTQYTKYKKQTWEAYKRVNEIFCDAILEVAKPDDFIWVHDYHFMLLPKLIREKLPDATIGFFLHIPFPSFEVFHLLPWREEIANGLLGSDLIGFHTFDYSRHFINNIRRLFGYEHDFGQIAVENRTVKVDTFPMGINYDYFEEKAKTSEVEKDCKRIMKKIGENKLILSIDRLDYTKGIPQRLKAFDLFLQENPEYKEKVTLVLVAVPSRTNIEHYVKLKKKLDREIGKINGKYGTIGWVPVWYIYDFLSFTTLIALYKSADVLLITPIRDGMNLMAKEFIATKTDGKGVLILGEMAGAAKELGEALIVNSNDNEEVANAIKESLKMPQNEQIRRNRIMQRRLKRYDVMRWANDFTDSLLRMRKYQKKVDMSKLTDENRKKLIDKYSKSDKRLILLDYDGTLTPIVDKPKKAMPDERILTFLKFLVQDRKNSVFIISGRDRRTLEKWFGNLNIGLIAEHGAWIKERKDWKMTEPMKSDWIERIKPILEVYVDRTPGSFIEEKELSIAWHYRKAEVGLSTARARELKYDLLHYTSNLNLAVCDGKKVIEIKNSNINKGRITLKLLSKKKWDFILAIGDDCTDEDVFKILPKSAYSIKVGLGGSEAKFNLDSVDDVRLLLRDIIKENIHGLEDYL